MFEGKKLLAQLQALNRRFDDAVREAIVGDLVIRQLKTELDRQIEQNNKLMDRFMARDFQTLQTYTHHSDEVGFDYAPDIDQLEENAGEILSVEKG